MKLHSKTQCLKEEDYYCYIAGSAGSRPKEDIESHLSSCRECREELASLLRIMDPDSSAPEFPEFDAERPEDIEDTLAFIQKTSRRESNMNRYRQWGAIAAAVVIGVALLSTGSLYLRDRIRSQSYCSQARLLLQEVYQPVSPSDLRLDLPFQSTATQRAASDEGAFAEAETLFHRALGVREGMNEALLGLGYVHLRKKQFDKAERQFGAVLGARPSDGQALLGRGVSRFEGALISADPVNRDKLLTGALADFAAALKANPGSNEARFNKIRVLYETGRHQEALKEIDAYISKDPDSKWALKLQDLKISMQTTSSKFLDNEINRAARERDAPALNNLARVVPYRVPVIVTIILRRALAGEGQPASGELPDSDSLQWAARTLASAYGLSSKDRSCSLLLDYYAGLSPPQKQLKKALDARLELLIRQYKKSDFKSILSSSESLIRDFINLKDYGQLVRVYQLRGSCYYYNADFHAAGAEWREMLEYSELTLNPDFIAGSLANLAMSYNSLHEYDKALDCLIRLKEIAESNHFEMWMAYASYKLGSLYIELNRIENSLIECLSASSISRRIRDPILKTSLKYLGIIMEMKDRFSEAADFYNQSLYWHNIFLKEGVQERTPDATVFNVNVLYRQGCLALHMNNIAAAKSYFVEAIRITPQNMRELECINRLGLAQAYMEEKNNSEAESQVNVTLEVASRNSYPEVEWKADSFKGLLLRQAGNEAGAMGYFLKAVRVLEGMRANVSSIDLRQSFFNQRFDPYRQIVSLLYHSQKDPKQALEYAERAKAMTLREYLSLHGELSDTEKPHSFGPPVSNQSISLPSGTVALEYFLSNDEFFVFISGSNGTEAVSVRLPLSEMEALVRQYLESINNNASSFPGLSQKLYKLLIDPILAKLQSQRVEALIILPDGPLHLLPFGSLMDSSGRYLLEKFDLSYAPSLKVLNHSLSQRKSGRITPASSIVFIDGASNLPGAGQELSFLGKLFPKRNQILNTLDPQLIGSTVENYEIIHFSGHAKLYQGKPRLVFQTSQGEAYLDSSAIQKWRLNKIRLVALAGCNTGIGPVFDGETPWGLVPSFLSAGAPSILVSLMPVDDLAASNLTSKFYDLLAHTASSKAQALRLAQLSLIKSLGADAQRHPLSWAPFVLIGDPL